MQRTTDGGATWTTVYDQHYMQMVPLDATRALVVTADTTLVVTPDGSTQQGASPCADTPDLGPMLADGVTTLDGTAWLTCGTLGAAAAPAELYRSSDAGATWALVAGATSLPCDGDVQFVDSTHGWCASRAGALFATSDGGGTWSDNNGVLVAPVADVQFIDQQHGWVSNLQQLAATMDGGARWAQVQLPGDAAAPAGTPGATRSYTNEQYGYSFEYPATYFDLGESRDLPAPLLDDKYFATANTSNPLELGLSDLWLTIRVVDNAQRESLESWAASHLNSPSDPDPPSVKRIVVGGRPAIQQIEDAMTGPHEPSYSVVTYVDEGDLVLCINGMGLAKSGFDAHAAEYQAMVAGMHLFTPATTDEPLGDGTSVSATAQAP